MTDAEKNILFEEVNHLLQIYNEYSNTNGNIVIESIKPCLLEMIDYIIKDKGQAAALSDMLDESDFWTAPASSKFHGNYKSGLSAHTLLVIKQSLTFAKPVLENYFLSPKGQTYIITCQDIFISALAHDFCKTNFYTVEYRNTKDITGNWIKQPFYKTKQDNRNLGHGNESVLQLLKVMPSYINNRLVIEAISRHMGFSDLSTSEGYNYSLFLENPLVLLLQLADQSAAQWFNC